MTQLSLRAGCCCLPLLLAAPLAWAQAQQQGAVPTPEQAWAQMQACEQAWAEYNEFKARYVMEESQYPLTVQGAAVRAACGAEALPAPPGSDDPPLPRVRKPRPTPPPASVPPRSP